VSLVLVRQAIARVPVTGTPWLSSVLENKLNTSVSVFSDWAEAPLCPRQCFSSPEFLSSMSSTKLQLVVCGSPLSNSLSPFLG
jgi:hypothetical protein